MQQKKFLKYFKENAEKCVELKLNKKNIKITKAVMTVPYHFRENRQNIIKNIGI